MIIRKLSRLDLPIRVAWMNNPKVYQSMHFDVPILLENTEIWYERVTDNRNRFDCVFEENGEIVAFGGLTGIDQGTGKAELYIFVNPSLHRGGIGTTATKLLCRYGFDHLQLNKVYLETNEDNAAARRVYEKCGFHLEGVLREEYKTADGKLLSRMYYGLLKGELNE